MKIMIASDVHGSAYYARKIIDRFNEGGFELLILLGDIFNHGPRNPLPKDYAPLEVAEMLNGIKQKLLVVKGNCDSEVDTLISQFDFITQLVLVESGKKILCTHGHIYNKDNLPSTTYDAIIYGHFHTGYIEKIGGTLMVNAGSVSLPKDGTPNSFVTVDDGKISLFDVDGNLINSKTL